MDGGRRINFVGEREQEQKKKLHSYLSSREQVTFRSPILAGKDSDRLQQGAETLSTA